MLASATTKRPRSIEELIPPGLAAALDSVDLHSRRLFAGRMQGERRSKQRGRGVEFEDYRNYVPGDDLRHIDWSVFARLDRLFIRVFQEQQDLSLHIVLDASPSMDAGTPNKLLLAQRLAMAFGYLALAHNNRAQAWVFSPAGLRTTDAMRGRRSAERLARFLIERTFLAPDAVEPGALPPGDFTSAMRSLAQGRSGRGVVVVLSDFLVPASPPLPPGVAGYERGLSMLAGNGWDVVLLQVLSPGELDPASEVDGAGNRAVIGDLRLTDSETGAAAEVTVSGALLESYRRRLEAYQRRLATFARARGMTHTMAPSNIDEATLLLRDLRRLGVLG